MSLRVTQSMMNAQLLRNVSNNLGRMNSLQNQLSTGKRINAPSDDPVGLTFAMRYRSEIASGEQYIRNTDAAISMIDFTDTMLGQAGDVLHRVRELMVKGADGAQPQTAYDAIKLEIKELYNQMIEIGNSSFNGKHVFNGEQTEKSPYPKVDLDDTSGSLKAYQVASDTGIIRYELSPGMTMAVNVTGNQVFGDPIVADPDTDSDNVFQVLRRVYDALSTGDSEEVSNLLAKIDTRVNTILEMRSEIGARSNRVQLVMDRLEGMNLNLTDAQSKVEDADLALVITNLKMSENVYQASLSAGAKLISVSLVDFLR